MNVSQTVTPQGLYDFMAQANNTEQWNALADEVKAFHGGYPDYWFRTVIMSGLAGKING